MSRYEDEEEDELQLILEGRDVPLDHYYSDQSDKSDQSDQSDSEEEVIAKPNTSIKKKQFLDESQQSVDYNRDKKKKKSNHHIEDESVGRTRVTEDLKTVASHELDVEADNNDEQTETEVKKKVRRIVSQPRVKLDANKLMSAEGIAILPEIFADMKFSGKGHELKDLNAIMFRLSHWSHRLFPSLTFDDFIDKCEQLGHKKAAKNFVNKIRYDMPLNIAPDKVSDDEDEDDADRDKGAKENDFDDDFDDIIANNYSNLCEKRPEFDSDHEDDQDFHLDIVSDTVEDGTFNSVKDIADANIVNAVNSDEDTVGLKRADCQKGSIHETSVSPALDKELDIDENEELNEEEILNEINSDD